MKNKQTITILVLLISVLAIFAAASGIFSNSGNGSFQYTSIRGDTISIYGKGIYRHMSSGVAIQGIAQDYVTLFLGVPLLLVSCYGASRNSFLWRFILLGTLGYFFVSYLFYLVMAMFNEFFLVYTTLAGTSFFAMMITGLSFDVPKLPDQFEPSMPGKFTGSFLIFTSLSIGLLWLSIVIPPLINGSIYPKALEHYTTLIVQGLDLGILLPLSFISGFLIIKKNPLGYLLAPSYLIFLSILMTALVAKIIFMGMHGDNIIPVIFIIPTLTIISMICSYLLLKNLKGYQA